MVQQKARDEEAESEPEQQSEDADNEARNEDEAAKREGGKKTASELRAEKLKKFSRSLRKREKLLYAPMNDIGLLLFDDTGDYINIPDKHVVFTEREGVDD